MSGTTDSRGWVWFGWAGLLALGWSLFSVSELYAQPNVVEGRVVDATTQAPISRAQVELCRDSGKMRACPVRFTDGEGRYTFPGTQAGKYRLEGEALGYLQDWLVLDGSGSKLIDVGHGVTHLATLRLKPEATLTGRVVDENGKPVAGLTVTALREEYAYGQRFLSEYQYWGHDPGGLMDKNGVFRIRELKAGRYYLQAAYGGSSGSPSSPGERGDVPVYYPDELSIQTATPLDIVVGEQRHIDIHLHSRPRHTIRGTLDFPSSVKVSFEPLYGLSIESGAFLTRWKDQYDHNTRSFALGPLPQGKYQLSIASGIYREDAAGCEKVTLADADIDGLVIHMRPAFTLRGRVDFPTGMHPATSYSVRLNLLPDKGACKNTGEMDKPDGSGVPVGTDGKVAFGGLYTERYKLWLFTEDPLYVKSARLGEQDVLAGGLQLNAAPDGVLKIVLAKANADVAGIVVIRGGPPVAGADVKLMAQGEDAPYVFKSVNAAEDGTFVLKGVPPGSYDLVALDEVVRDGDFGPAEFADVKDSAVRVQVGDASPERVRLTVEQ